MCHNRAGKGKGGCIGHKYSEQVTGYTRCTVYINIYRYTEYPDVHSSKAPRLISTVAPITGPRSAGRQVVADGAGFKRACKQLPAGPHGYTGSLMAYDTTGKQAETHLPALVDKGDENIKRSVRESMKPNHACVFSIHTVHAYMHT